MPTASNLADGPNADEFAAAVAATDRLLVPTLVMPEVARRLDAQSRRRIIPQVVAHMRAGQVVQLDATLVLSAAAVGRQHDRALALADSIVYATALAFEAVVWTQDADFKSLEPVGYRAHSRRRRR